MLKLINGFPLLSVLPTQAPHDLGGSGVPASPPLDHSPISLLALVSQSIFHYLQGGGILSLVSGSANPSPNQLSLVPDRILSCLLHLLNQIKHLYYSFLWPLYFFFTVIYTLPII